MSEEKIYEKEIQCKSHLLVSRIEDEMYHMISSTMMREFEILKRMGLKHAPHGEMRIKIKIKITIEEDNG